MPRPLPAAASVALAGAATMALELLLPRRLAPHVGTTSAVWTAVFAVVLGGLALGTALGARVADRPGAPRREALALLVAAALAAVASPVASGVAAAAAGTGPAAGALLGAAAAGLPAFVALGAVYPLAAARALRDPRHRGRTLGLLAAAGAVGSVGGTFAASYGLLPHLPVPTGFLAVAGVLAATAAGRAGADPEIHVAAVPLRRAAGADGPPVRWPALRNAVVGAAVLGLEVVAGRRAAVDAGSSLEAWTAVIAVVLAGLSLGGALGGWAGDRFGPRRALAVALGVAALLAVAAPFTASRLGEALRHGAGGFGARTARGVAEAYLALFTALGAVPPLLARAAVGDGAGAGRAAGRVSAAGTLGALVGALATGPWLVPALRLEGAAPALGAALAAVGAGLAVRRGPLAAVAVVALAATGLARADLEPVRRLGLALGLRADAPGTWLEDGPYARVVVDDEPDAARYGRPVLRMRIDARTHGVHDPQDPAFVGSKYGTMYDAVARALMADRPRVSALFLGGGTYTAPRAVLRRWPAADVLVAEIDPAVTDGALARLDLDPPPRGLRWVHEDGRTVVRDAPTGGYDLVFADAFGDVGVPWHLTTLEFLAEVRRTLAPGGVFLANTIELWSSGGFLGAMLATVRATFPHVQVVSVDRVEDWAWNFVFVASDRPFDLHGVRRRDPLDPDGPGAPLYVWPQADLDALVARTRAQPLRDDFAPVERLLAPLVEKTAPR